MADIVAYLYAAGYFGGYGSAERGRLLLGEKGCIGCHRPAGGASLLEPARYTTGTQAFAALINHVTVPGVAESDWALLTGADVGHLVAFLTSPQR
jgi:cytochrome c551/c552